MKTGIKCENDEFLVMSLKDVLGFIGRANRTITPKMWAIAHQNSHKTQKQRVLLKTLKRASGV